MHVSNVARALSTSALVALLTGCSAGTSALSPMAQTQSGPTNLAAARKTALANRNVSPFASKRAALLVRNERPILNLASRGFAPIGAHGSKAAYVFASDNYTGNVDAYDPTSGAMVSQCVGCGGWGVAVSPKGLLAIGTFDSTVTIWSVSSRGIRQIATCTSSTGQADGVTFDSKGNLYADNFPTTAIDAWSKNNIASGCNAAPNTVYTTNLQAVFYLGSSEGALLADGTTNDEDVDLVSVDKKTGDDTILQTAGNLSEGTAFPGGIAAGAQGAVYLNNQLGSIDAYSNGGAGSLTDTCNWTFDPNDYTGIAVGKTGGVWGADFSFGGSQVETYGEEVALPLGGSSCNVTVDTSPAQISEEYLGIAVYPAAKT